MGKVSVFGVSLSWWLVIYAVAALVLFIGYYVALFVRHRNVKKNISEHNLISARSFLRDYHLGKLSWHMGYAAFEQPGCFIIFVNLRDDDANGLAYDDVFVGRSVNVFSRLRQYLIGQGNGVVYAAVKAHKDVKVSVFLCDEGDLDVVKGVLMEEFPVGSTRGKALSPQLKEVSERTARDREDTVWEG